jgi:hypothetical protein
MLSVAMHLAAHRDRPFAAAQGDNGEADFIIRNNFETASLAVRVVGLVCKQS